MGLKELVLHKANKQKKVVAICSFGGDCRKSDKLSQVAQHQRGAEDHRPENESNLGAYQREPHENKTSLFWLAAFSYREQLGTGKQ